MRNIRLKVTRVSGWMNRMIFRRFLTTFSVFGFVMAIFCIYYVMYEMKSSNVDGKDLDGGSAAAGGLEKLKFKKAAAHFRQLGDNKVVNHQRGTIDENQHQQDKVDDSDDGFLHRLKVAVISFFQFSQQTKGEQKGGRNSPDDDDILNDDSQDLEKVPFDGSNRIIRNKKEEKLSKNSNIDNNFSSKQRKLSMTFSSIKLGTSEQAEMLAKKSSNGDAFSFFVIGSWGVGTPLQTKIARLMKLYATKLASASLLSPQPLAVISTGDQFWEKGISTNAADLMFHERFEAVYGADSVDDLESINWERDAKWLVDKFGNQGAKDMLAGGYSYMSKVPWIGSLGNWDCLGNVKSQVLYSKENHSPPWHMPHTYYTVTSDDISQQYFQKSTEDLKKPPLVEFFILDSCVLSCSLEKDSKRRHPDCSTLNYTSDNPTSSRLAKFQLKWLDLSLKNSKAEWKIIISHWPIYSSLKYGDTWGLKALKPIIHKYDVPIVLSGHSPGLQHILYINNSTNANATTHVIDSAPSITSFHQFVSAGGGVSMGSLVPTVKPHYKLKFGKTESGFLSMTINRDTNELHANFVGANGSVIYRSIITNGNKKKTV